MYRCWEKVLTGAERCSGEKLHYDGKREVEIFVQVTKVFETRPEEVLEVPPDHFGCASERGPE